MKDIIHTIGNESLTTGPLYSALPPPLVPRNSYDGTDSGCGNSSSKSKALSHFCNFLETGELEVNYMQFRDAATVPLGYPRCCGDDRHNMQDYHEVDVSSADEFDPNLDPHGVVVVGAVGHPDARIVRIVHISDTRGFHTDYIKNIPMGHIFIHSGDFGKYQFKKRFNKVKECEEQLLKLNHFFGQLPHTHKIFVPGNEDFSLDCLTPQEVQQRLSNAIFLHDKSCSLMGLKFFGSAWSIGSKACKTLFSGSLGYSRNSAFVHKRWSDIPNDTDILITHMAPWNTRLHSEVVNRIKPIIHLFGDEQCGPGIRWEDRVLFSNGAMYARHSPTNASASYAVGHYSNRAPNGQLFRYSSTKSSRRFAHEYASRNSQHSFKDRNKCPNRRYVNLNFSESESMTSARHRPIVIDVYVIPRPQLSARVETLIDTNHPSSTADTHRRAQLKTQEEFVQKPFTIPDSATFVKDNNMAAKPKQRRLIFNGITNFFAQMSRCSMLVV